MYQIQLNNNEKKVGLVNQCQSNKIPSIPTKDKIKSVKEKSGLTFS